MARRAGKIDANQGELVTLLRSLGLSVGITSSAHGGFPDAVVGYGGVTVLVEIKDGSKSPSRRRLTPEQVDFHGRFAGAITVIETPDQAIELANRIRQVAARLGPVNWNMGAVAYERQTETQPGAEV